MTAFYVVATCWSRRGHKTRWQQTIRAETAEQALEKADAILSRANDRYQMKATPIGEEAR